MNWPPATLRNVDGRWPKSVYPFAAPENVSTERPLLTLTGLGLVYEDLNFTLRNLSVNIVAFYLDRSESGVVANVGRDTIYVAPGGEGKFVVRNEMSLYYGISAAGDPGSGFPTSSISWTIVGKSRG